MENEALDCRDLILDDVIGITLILFDSATFSRPQNIQSTDIAVVGQYSVTADFHLSDGSERFQMAQSPSISLNTVRLEQGLVYTHELSIVLTDGISLIEDMIDQLQHNDFAIIYTKADGRNLLSLPLHNTSAIVIEESFGSAPSATVKVHMQSMSGLISLTLQV